MVFCLIFVCVCLCSCSYFSEKRAEALKEYGKEMFLKNDFDNYRQSLRNCGLSDLDFEPFYYSYDFEKDFGSAENHLTLECHLGSFKSDEIDYYYQYFPGYNFMFTREYNIEEFAPLLHTMSSIWRAMEKNYTYRYDGSFAGYVTVKICEPYEFDKLTITSSTGHIYEYRWSWAYPSNVTKFSTVSFKESYNDKYSFGCWSEDRARP